MHQPANIYNTDPAIGGAIAASTACELFQCVENDYWNGRQPTIVNRLSSTDTVAYGSSQNAVMSSSALLVCWNPPQQVVTGAVPRADLPRSEAQAYGTAAKIPSHP